VAASTCVTQLPDSDHWGLRADGGPEPELLRRFVGMIQVQRQDFNGRMITLRAGDLRAIACLLGVTVDAMGHRLEDLGLIVVS
jgi:hypothetical protein